ncbi:M23 family metallopeptidase [Paenibacillus tarimensis]
MFKLVRSILLTAITAGLLLSAPAEQANAAPVKQNKPAPAKDEIFVQRRDLFERVSALTGIPWYNLAAIDQYERTLTIAHPKKRPKPSGLVGIYIPPEKWAGYLNPDNEDTAPASIRWFSGLGQDGNGDGKADAFNDADLLLTIAHHVLKFGTSEEDFAIGLWEYYHNTRAVQRIIQFSKIYAALDRLDLFDHAFPLPVGTHYSYRSTWGAGRGWGGNRIHEGTDLFADYGLPVRSTCYGIVEIKGWNKYGGWRIGIRDLNNIYHYYAHLSGFEKSVKVGDIVKPGQTIGWVGSSGYGKPGTQGKFPPHLHYGVYRDRGLIEWAFDPYPMLHQWERLDRMNKRKKK